MPTVQVTKEQLADLIAKGLIPAPKKGGKKPKGGELVEASFTAPATWVIPLKTVSEANSRGWHGKAARTQAARRAVTQALGRHLAAVVPYAEAYHAGRAVRVTITRLGGAKLDAMSNLGAALKAVEDAVALVMGADDGAPNWRCRAEQEPGGAFGVCIQLDTGEGAA
jgi:hypothetical protein